MNKKNLSIIIILFIITVIYYIPIIKSPLAVYDEAVIIVGAERILKGQIPYKDFFTPYAPGQFYTLAALFKVFGTSVFVERVYDIAIKSLLSLLIFLIIRLLSSNKTALVGWAMSLIWIEYSYFHAYPVYVAILLIYTSVYCLLLYMKQQKNYFVILSAISIVFAILFRHDLGGLAAIVVVFVLILRRIVGVQISWTPLFTYIVSGAGVGLPIMVYFLLNSDIEAIINDLFIIPFDMVANQQNLPYPSLSRYNLPFFVFPTILIMGVITFFILIIKRKMDNTIAFAILLISLVGIVFFNQLWGRSDTIHLLGVALSGILLSPILLYIFSRMLSINAQTYRLLFVLFVVFFGITLSKPINKKLLSLRGSYTIEVVNPELERAKHPYIPLDIKKVVSYIQKNTSKDEYIYVGVTNHDQFVFNDAIIYFLADRNCATKYHELNPGINTTSTVQAEMIEELKDKHVQLIVLAPRSRKEPNLSGVDSRVDLLDNYISTNYEMKEKYGLYEIWIKKLMLEK